MRKSIALTILLTSVVLAASIPVMYANSVMAPTIPRHRLRPVYSFLESQVNVVCCANYHLLTLSFTTPTATNASVFFSVGTFIPPGQCCQGAFLELISVDDGPLGGEQGLGCGGQTSQFTGTLIGVSCFGRLAFTPGTHSVTLVLFIGGGGPFVVERGPSTAILVQFD